MSTNKCIASQDGICQNVHAFGIKCNGYSEQCRLRPAYNTIENFVNSVAKASRRAYGIVGDREDD